MSLRSVGNQLLQTIPGSLLAGASAASLSFWIRLNPGNNVANPNGVAILGDAGGKFSATLSGTGSLRLRWSSIDGNSSGSSSCGLTLALGTSYHLATAWEDGAQRYYLNGVLVHADTQAGAIGVLGDVAAHPFRLGSDSAGTDASLGDPTLWIGHALSAQEVVNLRDRAVPPSSIAPSSIALRWSLSGPEGIAARVGDPGLADASASGLDLSTVVGSAPTYQAAALTYLAPPLRALVAPSGESFAIRPLDGSGRYREVLSIQSGNDEQTFSPAKATVSGSFPLSINGEATPPIAFVANDPGRFARWSNIPVTPGVPHRVSLTVSPGIYCRNDVLVEIIEADLVRAVFVLDQYQALPGDFVVASDGVGGQTFPITFRPVSPAYVPTTSTISVRLSAPAAPDSRNNNLWIADALHVQGLVSGQPTGPLAIYDDTTNYAASGADLVIAGGYGEYYHGSFHAFQYGSGAGSTYTYPIGSAGVQSALEALPSIGAGNVKVTIRGSRLHVEFVKARGATAMPALNSTSPAFVNDQVTGGFVPSIRIKPSGGSFGPPIRLTSQWVPHAPGLTWAWYPFDGAGVQATRFLPTDEVEVTVPAGWMTLGGTDDVQTISFANSPTGGTFKLVGVNPITGGGFTTDNIAYSTNSLVLDERIRAGIAGLVGNGNVQVKALVVTWIGNAQSRPVTLMTASEVALTGAGATPTATVARTTLGVLGSTLTPGVYTAENHVGGTMLPTFVNTPKTMGIGQNVQPDSYYSECLTFLNAAARDDTAHKFPLANTGYLAWDVNGDPTLLATEASQLTVSQVGDGLVPTRDGVGGIGPQNVPIGKWTFYWDGPFAGFTVGAGGIHTNFAEDVSFRVVTNTTNNRIVVDCQPVISEAAAPWVQCQIRSPGPQNPDGSWPCATKKIRAYPPDPSDPTGQTPWLNPFAGLPAGVSGRFHPSFLAKNATLHSIRPMQALGPTMDNPYADFADIKPDSWLSRTLITRTSRVFVKEVRAYTGPALNRANLVLFEFETETPHGFFSGQPVNFENCGTVIFSDPRFPNEVLNFSLAIGSMFCQVISPTVFVAHGYKCEINGAAVNGVTMANVLTRGQVDPSTGITLNGGVNGDFGTAWSLADCVALVNDLDILYPGVPRRLWYTLSVTATDACIDAIADYIAANLRPGIECCCEFGNECWNGPYRSCGWLTVRAFQQFGELSYESAYAVGQGRTNNRFQARFDAAGRGPDFVHVFATISSGTSPTDFIMGFAKNPPNGDAEYRVDEVALAPYVANYNPGFPDIYPGQEGFDERRNKGNPKNIDLVRSGLMTTAMHLDALELNTDDPGIHYAEANTEVVRRYYPDAKMVAYEGGWESLILGMDLGNYIYFKPGLPDHPSQQLFPLQYSIHRHPRMYGITGRLWEYLQDNGFTLFTNFYTCGGGQWQAWSTYEWWGMQDGTGDPAENPDYRNTSNLTTGGQVPVKSQVGGRIADWNRLVGAAPSTLVPGTATGGAVTNTTAAATATAATGATGTVTVQWYRSLVSGSNGSPVGGQTTLTLADTGLTPGTNYYYRLKYTDDLGSAYSNQVAMSTTGGGTTLAAGTATAGTTTATTANATATGATGATGAVAHQWYRSPISGQPGSPVSGQTTLILADSGLTPGTTYYYRLRYTDTAGAGSSVDSNQVALTTAAGTLTAGTASAGIATSTTATASATDAAGGTAPYAYQWYRSPVVGQAGSPVAGQTTLALADSGLTPGTTYYYRLRYTDASAAGSSVDSNQVAVSTTGGGTTSPALRYVPVSTTPTARGWAGKPRRPIR